MCAFLQKPIPSATVQPTLNASSIKDPLHFPPRNQSTASVLVAFIDNTSFILDFYQQASSSLQAKMSPNISWQLILWLHIKIASMQWWQGAMSMGKEGSNFLCELILEINHC